MIDTGSGIPLPEQTHIFHEFYRAEETRALHDGLGLGLSIVKRLCHLIGAEITVRSEVGQGSRFMVQTTFSGTGLDDDGPRSEIALKARDTRRSLQGKSIAII